MPRKPDAFASPAIRRFWRPSGCFSTRNHRAPSRPRQYCPRDSTASPRRSRRPLSLRRSSHRRKTHSRARSPIPSHARLGAPRTSRRLSREKTSNSSIRIKPPPRNSPAKAKISSSSRPPPPARRFATTCRSSTRSSKTPTRARSTSSPPKRSRRINWPSCTTSPRASTIDSASSPTMATRPATRAKPSASAATSILIESRHAAHRHPAAPHQLDAPVRKSALHRARRTAHLSRRLRQPSRQRAAPPSRASREFYGSQPAIHLLLGHHRQSRRARRAIDRRRRSHVIEENGAPAAEKLFVFYNPPMVNRNLGIRRSYINETTRVAKEFLARKLANHRLRQ